MMKSKQHMTMIRSLSLLLFSAALCLPCSADSRSWQNSLSKAPAGPYKKKKHCKLNYIMSWKGTINSGECTVEFNRNSGSAKTVSVQSTGRTSGLARRVFPYDFKIQSKYRGDTLRPVSYHIWEQTRDESKTIDGYFSGSKVTTKEKTITFETKKPLYRKSSYEYPNLFDLYSSILYVGSQPLNKGDKVNMVVYPFDKPYLAKVTVLGREKHLGHDCIKLDFKMSKINKDLALKHYDKMKSATMWLSDNSDRVMVELRSEVFIGDVRVTLKSSEWN